MDTDAIASIVQRSAAEHHVPGIAWGVVREGGLAHAGAVGTARADRDDPPWRRTLFRIASMTKSFTAAAVLLLRDDGLLRLDDAIADHVPELVGAGRPTSDAPPVTVRHVLTMAAGFATDDPWADRHLDATDGELDAILRAGPTPADAPGVRFEYSNTGYAALGRLVVNVSGQRSQDIVTERLLRPLGMADTVWVPEAATTDHVARGHRWQDDEWLEEVPLGDGGYAPMGGLWSTLEDLGRWVAFLDDAFPPRDDADDGPLRRASRREMQQAQRAFPSELTEATETSPARLQAGGYGMGLRVLHDLRFVHVAGHSGGLPGFGSHMRWLPGRRIGVVALGNVTYAPMAALCQMLLEALDDQGELPAPPRPSDELVRPFAERLTALLNDWDDARAADLFADNVDLDDPLPRRAAAARRLVDGTGELRLEELRPTSRTSATARLRGQGGEVRLELQLSPQEPPRLQWYEVKAPPAQAPVADQAPEQA